MTSQRDIYDHSKTVTRGRKSMVNRIASHNLSEYEKLCLENVLSDLNNSGVTGANMYVYNLNGSCEIGVHFKCSYMTQKTISCLSKFSGRYIVSVVGSSGCQIAVNILI